MGAVWKKRWWWLVFFLILAMLSFAHWTEQERIKLSVPEEVVRGIYGFLQVGVEQFNVGFEKVNYYFVSKDKLHNDNRLLQDQADKLRMENQQLKEYQNEASRLQQILGFRNYSPQYQLLGTRVIARSPGYWNETLFIDRGSQDGIKRDLAVITPDGLVGRIINVQQHTSEVLLITSRQSGVGTIIQQSRAPGIVNGLGNDGYLTMNNIPYFVKINAEEEVITSGLSTVFPPGIPVGKVIDIATDQNGLTRSARVHPAADLDRLEEVLVVTNYLPQAVPPMLNPESESLNPGGKP